MLIKKAGPLSASAAKVTSTFNIFLVISGHFQNTFIYEYLWKDLYDKSLNVVIQQEV